MFLPKMENYNLKTSNAMRNLMLFYMSFVCHSYVICMYSYVTRMSFIRYSHLLVCHLYIASMSSVHLSYVLVCHSYAIRMYPFVIYHSYVLLCHPFVTRMSSAYLCHSSVVLPWTSKKRLMYVQLSWCFHGDMQIIFCLMLVHYHKFNLSTQTEYTFFASILRVFCKHFECHFVIVFGQDINE